MKKYFFVIILFVAGCSSHEQLDKETFDSLIQNRWAINSMNGKIFETRSPIYFRINADSSVSGFAGCNNFWSSAKIEKQKIAFTKIGTTRMYCDDMSAEEQFLSLLQNKFEWRIIGDSLFFFIDAKEKLKFTKLHFVD